MFIGIAAGDLATVIGSPSGAIAGLRGGKFDDRMMRVTDVFLAFPFLVAVIVVREFLGGDRPSSSRSSAQKTSIRFVIFLLAIFAWMGVARLVRGQVLSLKEREFIEAARAVGASERRIIMSHLLPNSIGPILVALTLTVIGADRRRVDVGVLRVRPAAGRRQHVARQPGRRGRRGAATQGNWWLVVFPCGALVLIAICINFIGDGLRDAFDPKMEPESSPWRTNPGVARLARRFPDAERHRAGRPRRRCRLGPARSWVSSARADPGKSVTFLGVLGLLPKSAVITGSAKVGGSRVGRCLRQAMRSMRGKKVAMIFQDPLSALNPVHRVGDQIVEMIRSHQDISSRRRRSGRSNCSRWSAFHSPTSGHGSTRTSSPAACASVS